MERAKKLYEDLNNPEWWQCAEHLKKLSYSKDSKEFQEYMRAVSGNLNWIYKGGHNGHSSSTQYNHSTNSGKDKTGFILAMVVIIVIIFIAFNTQNASNNTKSGELEASSNKNNIRVENTPSTVSTETVQKVSNDNKIDGFEMVFVQGGTFQMGSNDGETDEKPVHSVSLSDFYIGKYEVTQKEWKLIMDNNPSRFKGDDLPVEQVSWDDCQDFIKKINAKTGKEYRLPTEAEWEYAARGGNKSRDHTYSGSNNIDDVAWYKGNSGDKTHPVGKNRSNELGIYDMTGNVWEWCSDLYCNHSSGLQINPQGPTTGVFFVLRGGSYYFGVSSCRVAHRNSNDSYLVASDCGFRLAMGK
jgi:formylglycine-generating enzyme required for sulfatase activity